MDVIERFRDLHRRGFFVMPNAWDVGSAVRLERLGFSAVATTSSGHAASLGRSDQQVTFDELCAHVEAVTASVSIPLSVDSERLFSDDPAGVAANVGVLGRLGAAGVSIEDYDPSTHSIDPIDVAADRVVAAVSGAQEHGLVVTARAENHLYGAGDLDDTIHRLLAYARAGADCVYAPGLAELSDITRVVDSVDTPVNVLLRPASPPLVVLADLGVRRVSVGGRLAHVAYDAMETEARSLLAHVAAPGDDPSTRPEP